MNKKWKQKSKVHCEEEDTQSGQAQARHNRTAMPGNPMLLDPVHQARSSGAEMKWWMDERHAGKIFVGDCFSKEYLSWVNAGGLPEVTWSFQGMFSLNCSCDYCVRNRFHHQQYQDDDEDSGDQPEPVQDQVQQNVKYSKRQKRRYRKNKLETSRKGGC